MITLEWLREAELVPAYLKLPDWSLLLPNAEGPPATILEWSTHLAGPDEWWEMIARLRQAGCLVHFSDDFPEEPTYVEPDDWYGELEPAGNGWFDLALDIEVEANASTCCRPCAACFGIPAFRWSRPLMNQRTPAGRWPCRRIAAW